VEFRVFAMDLSINYLTECIAFLDEVIHKRIKEAPEIHLSEECLVPEEPEQEVTINGKLTKEGPGSLLPEGSVIPVQLHEIWARHDRERERNQEAGYAQQCDTYSLYRATIPVMPQQNIYWGGTSNTATGYVLSGIPASIVNEFLNGGTSV
jgi:hypothetical protein